MGTKSPERATGYMKKMTDKTFHSWNVTVPTQEEGRYAHTHVNVAPIFSDGTTCAPTMMKIVEWDYVNGDPTWANFYTIKIGNYPEYKWCTKTPTTTAPALFPSEVTETSYNNGQGSRDRQSMALVYCKNIIHIFTGSTIPGVIQVTGNSYNKNGKWSSTTYQLMVAAGWKFVSLMEDFSNGRYVNHVESIAKIAEDLCLVSCQPTAVEEFIKTSLYGAYKNFAELCNAREEFENASNDAETISYTFRNEDGTRKQGVKCLLIDGECWHPEYNPMPGVVLVTNKSSLGRGCYDYEMQILATAETQELYAYSAYGDDGVEVTHYLYAPGFWCLEPEIYWLYDQSGKQVERNAPGTFPYWTINTEEIAPEGYSYVLIQPVN